MQSFFIVLFFLAFSRSARLNVYVDESPFRVYSGWTPIKYICEYTFYQ